MNDISLGQERSTNSCDKFPQKNFKILFFSGGTAPNLLVKEVAKKTPASIHIMTSFDSGGSSAKLRQAFNMPAVGDIRNRILALSEAEEIKNFLNRHLPEDIENNELSIELTDLCRALTVSGIPPEYPILESDRAIIADLLDTFIKARPKDFDLRGGCIGNFVLTGAYLKNDRNLDRASSVFSELLKIKATVTPVTEENLHLLTYLEDGRVLSGQHLLTGKEDPVITSPAKKIQLVKLDASGNIASGTPECRASKKAQELIEKANLIVYPMGSFYSRLLVNLLPKGVGKAVGLAECPKAFIPNPNENPESLGLTTLTAASKIIDALRESGGRLVSTDRLLSFVLLDRTLFDGQYVAIGRELKHLGVRIITGDFLDLANPEQYDPVLLADLLLSPFPGECGGCCHT